MLIIFHNLINFISYKLIIKSNSKIITINNAFRFSLLGISISLLSACGGGGGSGSTPSLIQRSNGTVLNSGTSLTYSTSNASTLAATSEFDYINYENAASSQNPLEVINAHKAYGYGLTGSGETIAILDSGFYNSHNELNSKTINTYGTLDTATGVSVSADHGLFVSSVASGEDDGTGMQGVAPSASLHISDYTNLSGNTYYPTHWANATDNASTATAQNNSWGVDYQIDTLKSDISSNSWTNDYGIAQKWNSSGYTANESSATAYITALNNFQDHGVVVYALSNDSDYTDADFQAALPELFSQLKEAWISAVNVEITGTSGNETYTRKSAPCGSTGEYCLGADGYQVNGAAYSSDGNNYYWTNASGTSFVAPQISGAVALLAEAFPNHNPAQLTDRLFASADNSFFSHSNAVKFGNGVEHGFNTEFGHGIMDIYSALNPITSSTYTRLFTGGSIQSSSSYQLENSRLSTSRSFGDSLVNGLKGETGYTYDDLDGGFKYDMSFHVDADSNMMQKFDISSELSSLEFDDSGLDKITWKKKFDNVISTLTENDKINSFVTINSSSLPVQSFFDSNIDSAIDISQHYTSFLGTTEDGIGIGAIYSLDDSRLLLGMTSTVLDSTTHIDDRKTISASVELGKSDENTLTLITGVTQDKGRILGSTGQNAFSLDGSDSNTLFTAIKAQAHLKNDVTLTGISTIANTTMSSPSNSFIGSAENIKSNSFSLAASKTGLFGNDKISVLLNQPNRITDGVMNIKLASLARGDGEINYTNKKVSLEPSGRQIDLGLSYTNNYSDDLSFSIKHTITNNTNHNNDSGIMNSSFAGLIYKNIQTAVAVDDSLNNTEAEVTYSFNF